MDLAVATRAFGNDDKSWIGDAMHVDAGIPIELDLSLFDFVTNFPNGFLPSGLVLARVTGSGAYGHYDPGTVVNEVQSVVATGGSAGDFTLAFDGETTAAIAFDATAAAVQAALLALSNVAPGDVVCAGGPLPTTPVTITWGGRFADSDVAALVVADNITGGSAVITTPTPGGGAGAATGGAGLEVAKGHLLMPVSTTNDQGVAQATGSRPCSLFTRGRVREAKLPAHHGLDAAAKLALPLIQYLSANGDVT